MECCLLAYSPWLIHPAFLKTQDCQPRAGPTYNWLGPTALPNSSSSPSSSSSLPLFSWYLHATCQNKSPAGIMSFQNKTCMVPKERGTAWRSPAPGTCDYVTMWPSERAVSLITEQAVGTSEAKLNAQVLIPWFLPLSHLALPPFSTKLSPPW